MSYVGQRQDIAAALSSVVGVNGYPYRPSVPKAGDAWVSLANSKRVDPVNFEDTWRVLVFLPQTETSAEAWRDAYQLLIVNALESNNVGYVDDVDPVNLSTTDGLPTFGLQLTFRS